MKKRLSYISPLQLGIVQAVIMAIVSLIAVPFLLLAAVFGQAHAASGNALAVGKSLFLVVFFPIIYAIFGFIGGVISAFIYNIVAKFTGGIVYIAMEAGE
ncbi:MAG TPA: hypothetical protein VNV43_02985 [Candidatus Acidoferrales bacterium]|jgi:hypothetical protein|nr:hypothetical protein [Candidatus Acidoferrales bacterium]